MGNFSTFHNLKYISSLPPVISHDFKKILCREISKYTVLFLAYFLFLDRYVILGNHFDAWILGAVDPLSGTAAMLELSRVFLRLHNETGEYFLPLGVS